MLEWGEWAKYFKYAIDLLRFRAVTNLTPLFIDQSLSSALLLLAIGASCT